MPAPQLDPFARMDVGLEVHVPGLDLSPERWTQHSLFMECVHERVHVIAAAAWGHFEAHGRGTLFVDAAQWMRVIRGEWEDDGAPPPFEYVAVGHVKERADFKELDGGYDQILTGYDPAASFVLTVQQRDGKLLSGYLIRTDPGPQELHRRVKDAPVP